MNYSLLIIILSIAIYGGLRYASEHSRLAGTLPILHLGIPYGYTEDDLKKENLKGQYFIITGANSGLGLQTSEILAKYDANIILICRNEKKCKEATEKVKNQAINKNSQIIEYIVMDLSSFESIDQGYKKIEKYPIDHLFLNAGLAGFWELTLFNGVEGQFMVNHVGHFYLVKKLMNKLKNAKELKSIIPVSSVAHWDHIPEVLKNLKHYEDLDKHLNNKENYNNLKYYGISKIANILFGRKLIEVLNRNDVKIPIVHPGGIKSGLMKYMVDEGTTLEKISIYMQDILYWDENIGPFSLIGAALSKDIKNGDYVVPIARTSFNHPNADNKEIMNNLWQFTEEIIEHKHTKK